MKQTVTASKIQANWQSVERRPTWSVVSSRELAQILGVHLQTISNWYLRGILPEPEPHSGALKGNRNYYRISKIRAWLENKPEEQIHWNFAREHVIPQIGDIPTLGQVEFVVKSLYKNLGLEKPLIPLVINEKIDA